MPTPSHGSVSISTRGWVILGLLFTLLVLLTAGYAVFSEFNEVAGTLERSR